MDFSNFEKIKIVFKNKNLLQLGFYSSFFINENPYKLSHTKLEFLGDAIT